MNASIVGRAVVNHLGHVVRVVVCSGQRWAVARDIALCLLLHANAAGVRIAKYPDAFIGKCMRARIEGHPAESLLLSEEGIRLFVEGIKCKAKRSAVLPDLISWLDAGGLACNPSYGVAQLDNEDSQPIVDEELVSPEAQDHQALHLARPITRLRLVPRGPDPMQQLLEREKAYCRDLVKTLLRYCDAGEVDKLTLAIDEQIDHLLESRYCPGLNAACYELYRKYWLQGGEA